MPSQPRPLPTPRALRFSRLTTLVAALAGATALASRGVPPARAAEWPELGAQVAATGEGRNDAAVIVAIEDYAKVDAVLGARANADAWFRWFVGGRGIPAARVYKAYDADATDVKIRALAKQAAASVQPGGTVWFVFIGHGAPSKDGRDGLLVGVDADRTADGLYARSVPRQEVLALLDAGPQEQTVALLDACFSGQTGSGAALVAGLQPIVPTALLQGVSPRARVLTAAGSGEFSGPLPGTARPAFSYLALGGVMGWADLDGTGNRDGRVSAAELRDYVQGALNITVSGRTQTPTLLGEDGDLGRAAARTSPDLFALAGGGGAPGGGAVDRGGASVSTTTDFAALAAQAAAAKAARERSEREAAEAAERAAAAAKARAEAQAAEQARLEAELGARRRAELDRQAAEVRASAARDYAALRPLLSGEVTAETRPVLEAFVKAYGSATVRFDGVTEAVAVAEVEKVRGALGQAGQASSGKGSSGKGSSGQDWQSPTLGTMRWIPAGSFMMGSPASEAGHATDEVQHRVTLTKGFWLMEHEVTQGEWEAVMGSNPSGFSACGTTCPVEGVSWDDAVEFAKRASARDGVTYRLPTEAEWEYAARGGQPHVYAGGDEATAVGWIEDNTYGQAHPACKKGRNGYGLCDMTGNVWEWTADWYGAYPGGSVTDPTGASTGLNRVYRGGGWVNSAQYARVAFRYRNDPTNRYVSLGFRLARTSP